MNRRFNENDNDSAKDKCLVNEPCFAKDKSFGDEPFFAKDKCPGDEPCFTKDNSSGKDCCAVLLRGGKSRRMGRDKASLPWGEGTFLQAVASQLDFLEEKYLSVAAEDFAAGKNSSVAAEGPANDGLSPDWVRLPDLIPDCGPLGGIYTALSACRAEWILIASCDIPAVERRFFTMLLEERTDDAEIVYPLTPDGRMHMTCALYKKTIAPVVARQIQNGDNRLRLLTDLCRARAVPIEDPEFLRMLSNINTGEELAKLQQRCWKRTGGINRAAVRVDKSRLSRENRSAKEQIGKTASW